MKYCMIEVAFDNISEANKVISKLLEEKLVASCQMVESNSRWNWKNELESSKEYLVFMKTKFDLQDRIHEVISCIHSYDTFRLCTLRFCFLILDEFLLTLDFTTFLFLGKI